MKKRLLALLLSLVMVMSLLPVSAFAADGVTKVYTLADIKAATKAGATTIRLMNDIDVSKENYQFDNPAQGDAPIYCATGLGADVVFDGNGYTIYNLKSGIWRYSRGTIRNLNISIHDTEEDSLHLSDFGRAYYTKQIEYFGIVEDNQGTVENCNVTMSIDLEGQFYQRIGGIAIYNKGTIRNCIVNLAVDLTVEGYLCGTELGGIAMSCSGGSSLIESCLTLGHFTTSGQQSHKTSFVGIAGLSKETERCVDSACAMTHAEVVAQSDYYFSPAFQTYTGTTAGADNCRVADDMTFRHVVTRDSPGDDTNLAINESGTISGGEGYTLASRADILKDWDTSRIPADTPPTDIPAHTDPNVIPDDYVPIYTLADLKNCHDSYYLLMNDIDAAQEDVAYDGNGYNANSVAGRLFSGGVLNGNGHTIYNLKGPLFEYNMGTICNLNVTLNNTDEDDDVFMPGKGLAGIALGNANGSAEGLIENCTVTMSVNRSFGNLAGYLSINGISSGGTIRDCIARLNIYLDARSTDNNSGSISVSGIGLGSNFSLVDHCLVLGSVTVLGSDVNMGRQTVHFYGISAGTAQDSACALESLVVTAKDSRQDPYENFTLSSGKGLAGTSSIRSRVASDLKVSYNYNAQDILPDGSISQAGTFTLDTRENILKDWDISALPDPDTLLKKDFTRGTATFRFLGNVEKTRTWQFDYDDDYFYGQDDGFGYAPDLAKASLCLDLASFSAHTASNFDKELDEDDLTRAENIRALYHDLGFDPETYQFMNYNTALTDSDDKVAYSMAMKYIQNPDGTTDTLVAVPIRGGGYGNEWASNFHVADDFSAANLPEQNHVGFQTAANGVLFWLKYYINRHRDLIKGNLKLWVVGYSRGAATANLLGHALNELTAESGSGGEGLGGCTLHMSDVYVYTFATPAGATYGSAAGAYDPNIYNIISPVDLVPLVAPRAWGFTRYGTTLTLPAKNDKEIWQTFQSISGIETDGIQESQRAILSRFSDEAFGSRQGLPGSNQFIAFKVVPYRDLQEKVMALPTKDPSWSLSSSAKKLATIIELAGLAGASSFGTAADVLIRKDSVELAHYPEHYLARLENDTLRNESDFEQASRTRSVLLYDPNDPQNTNLNVNVEFWKSPAARAAGSVAGSYIDGVCTSGEVTVEMTDLGLVATFPAGADYTFTVSGADAGALAMTIYAYGSGDVEPVRTMDFNSLPAEDGSVCTVYIPEEPYDDFYIKDANGKEHYPDGGTPGDLNSDGRADILDVQFLYTYLITGQVPVKDGVLPVGSFRSAADINKDGAVDVYDLQRLYEAVSGAA